LWDHGHTVNGRLRQGRGDAQPHLFGDSINTFYQRDVERKFFAYNLKGEGQSTLPEALMFDTGKKEWKSFILASKDIPPVKL